MALNTNEADEQRLFSSMMMHVDAGWKPVLLNLWDKHAMSAKERGLYPPIDLVFRAFSFFSPERLKVVILGMDPYANPGQADGLAFSMPIGQRISPSLRNMFKEIKRSFGRQEIRLSSDLSDWARQGVLLLNTSFTVKEKKSGSDIKLWKDFTADLLQYISHIKSGIVFMLWGNHAHDYEKYLLEHGHLILKHSHPSPLSRKPFVGCNHFTMCNRFLEVNGDAVIDWSGDS